jgi:hypothetical protein
MSDVDHEKFMRRAIELAACAALDYPTGGPSGSCCLTLDEPRP